MEIKLHIFCVLGNREDYVGSAAVQKNWPSNEIL